MLVEKIEKIIAPKLAILGVEIIRIRLKAGKVLELMIERIDEKNITIDECVNISRHLSQLLDIDDPIKKKYTLEVSSPGIDRPLIREKDFLRFSGFQAKIETLRMYDGRKIFKGVLRGVNNHLISLDDLSGRRWQILFADIKKASLISDQTGKLLKGLALNG